MKKTKRSKLFLEALQTVPIVQVACEKTGISRNTAYRWKREDPDFAQKFDEAMSNGIAFVNDMSEGQLLQLIKDRSFSAVRYWLNNHHERFKKVAPKPDLRLEEQESERYKARMKQLHDDVTYMNELWFEDCTCHVSSERHNLSSEERTDDGQCKNCNKTKNDKVSDTD